MQTEKKTIKYQWVDFAKFTTIILIIFFHTPPPLSGFENVLISHLRLPAFFFLAGFLFNFERHPSFSGFVKHRSKQLLIPYFCFFFLFYLFWIFVGRKFSSIEEQNVNWLQPLFEYLYGRPFLVCWPLWFLAALFSMQCVFYLFRGKNRRVSVVILFLLPFIPSLIDVSQAPWMLDSACGFIFYYGIANLFKKEFFRFLALKSRFFIGFILLTIHIASNFLLQQSCPAYLKVPLDLLCSVSLLIPFFILIKLIAEKWAIHYLIRYIAANTLVILAFHTYGIRIFTLLISQLAPAVPESYGSKIIITFLVSVSMLPVIFIINRYFPFLLGRGKK
ncbi:MAG: acyltransferase family protein, partial [Dysgonamonadaceae bacterium]|nr:acyltransferase family protein [Dysgonamonadaceae bacterium]